MQSAMESLTKIRTSSGKIDRSKPQRFPEAASPGDTFRQGDLYITLLSGVPSGCVPIANPKAQLAEGTTQGSRHILDSLNGVLMLTLPNPTPLDGPVISLTKERTVKHPEHGHCILTTRRVYGITYQRAYAEDLRRAVD